MNLPLTTALALGDGTLSGGVALGGPKEDVCRVRASDQSGYSGLGLQVGRFEFRLSGSVTVGDSRSNAPADGQTVSGHGRLERQEARAKANYARIFKACMRPGV